MGRYQIRTQEEKRIEDVLDEMVASGWQAIGNILDIGCIPEAEFRRFRRSIIDAVVPFVRTFRLCGLSNICLDQVKTAPLSEHSEPVEVNPWDLVYHIFYRGDAEGFLDGITFEAVGTIKHLLPNGSLRTCYQEVGRALRKVLGQYLYYSPTCGHTELCSYSSSHPISPWNRH